MRFEMHYTPSGQPGKDKTRFGVWFSRQPVTHEVITVLSARTLVPGTKGGEPKKLAAPLKLRGGTITAIGRVRQFAAEQVQTGAGPGGVLVGSKLE